MSEEERRRLAEKAEQEQNQNEEPNSGDPEQRGERAPEGADTAPPSAGAQPAWVVSLPRLWRDAYVRGDFEKIPPEYRALIVRYLLWLQKVAGRANR